MPVFSILLPYSGVNRRIALISLVFFGILTDYPFISVPGAQKTHAGACVFLLKRARLPRGCA